MENRANFKDLVNGLYCVNLENMSSLVVLFQKKTELLELHVNGKEATRWWDVELKQLRPAFFIISLQRVSDS